MSSMRQLFLLKHKMFKCMCNLIKSISSQKNLHNTFKADFTRSKYPRKDAKNRTSQFQTNFYAADSA